MPIGGFDTGTLITIALAALTVASTFGAVLWRVLSCEKAIDRLTVKMDELGKVIVTQNRFDEHQREDDQRHQSTTLELNKHDVDIALLKVAVIKSQDA